MKVYNLLNNKQKWGKSVKNKNKIYYKCLCSCLTCIKIMEYILTQL